MELLPIGPVNFLDTAGINDSTALSNERIEKTMKILNRTDVAVIVCDYNGIDEYEKSLIEKFNELIYVRMFLLHLHKQTKKLFSSLKS